MKNVNYRVDKSGLKNSDTVMRNGVMIGLHHGLKQHLKYIHNKILQLIQN